jgi:phosphatidylglycerol lysyltransferase
VQYSNELWWQFELHSDASRFLRASVGASIVVVLFGLSRVLGSARYDVPPPTDDDLRDAEQAIAAQTATSANLVFLRDKAILFEEERRAFVMYGVHGRTWVALGDPVGPDERVTDAAREFLERCDDFGGVPGLLRGQHAASSPLYRSWLTMIKLGEAARVPLANFTLEGGRGQRHPTRSSRRLERDGSTFRIVPPGEVPSLLPELRAVSDEWLDAKGTGEKGFSLGFFDEAVPVAIPDRAARAVRPHRRLRKHLAERRTLRGIRRSDAISSRRRRAT